MMNTVEVSNLDSIFIHKYFCITTRWLVSSVNLWNYTIITKLPWQPIEVLILDKNKSRFTHDSR